jgi:SnoaL-like domain
VDATPSLAGDPSERVARAYLRALGGDDVEAIVGLVAPDFRNEHLSALGEGSTGRAAYRARLPGFLTAFPERAYRVVDLVAAPRGDTAQVVVRYELHAVHHDASRDDGARSDEGARRDEGGPPASRAVVVPGMMWLAVSGGLVTSRVDCWDSLTFLRQTDQVPPR